MPYILQKSKFIAPYHCVFVLLVRNEIRLIVVSSSILEDLKFFFPK